VVFATVSTFTDTNIYQTYLARAALYEWIFLMCHYNTAAVTLHTNETIAGQNQRGQQVGKRQACKVVSIVFPLKMLSHNISLYIFTDR